MFGSKLRLKKNHATLSEIFTPLFWSDIQATSSNIHAILPRIFMPPPGCVSVLCCDVPADCLPPACPPSLVDSLRQPLLPTAADHCLRPPAANRIGSGNRPPPCPPFRVQTAPSEKIRTDCCRSGKRLHDSDVPGTRNHQSEPKNLTQIRKNMTP